MKKLLSITLNTLFFTIIIVIAFAVATIALTRKVNDYRQQYNKGIKGTVIKEVVPVLSFSKGIVRKIHIKVGEKVKKHELLVEVDNPVLQGKVNALQAYPDNISAQTEAKVAQQELGSLNIYSPLDGVVSDITVVEGTPVEELGKVVMLYANENMRLLGDLSVNQYTVVQQLQQIQAYSPRLNQTFTIIPDILKPDEKTASDFADKKISLYFVFKNKRDAISLLNNEDLDLQLAKQDEISTKPIDIFVDFWNSTLAKTKQR
jgi:multidrug efflux pump subunit AcrA (membrane-fusion protein)